MAQARLFLGTHGSEREARVNQLVAEHWGRCVLLTPNRASATRRMESLLLEGGLPPCFGATVAEFNDFVAGLLSTAGVSVRLVSGLERTLLMEDCLARLQAEGRLAGLVVAPDAPGLVRHLLDVITQLKQGAVEPEEFRERVQRQTQPGHWDHMVADVYTAYQEALIGGGLHDVPGLYWLAHEQCVAGRPKALEKLELMAFDGFDDFTPSQLRLMEALVRHVPQVVFGLNCDTDPDRADLFALPLAARDIFLRRFDSEVVGFSTPAARTFTEHAANRVFWRNKPEPVEGLVKNLRLVQCLDLRHEMDCVLREIKRLALDEGVPLSRMAVVYPDLEAVDEPLRAAFEECGAPLSLRHQFPLWGSAVGAFVLQLLEAAELWERDTVAGVLSSPWFNPENAPQAHMETVHLLARAGNVIAGRGEWRRSLSWLADHAGKPVEGEEDFKRVPHPDTGAAARSVLERFDALCAQIDRLPATAPRGQFVRAFADILRDLHPERGLAAFGDPAHAALEKTALAALNTMLETLAMAGAVDDPMDRRQFAALVSRSVRQTAYACPPSGPGVSCGRPSLLRGRMFDHVFYCGMNEGVVPRPPSANAVYGEADMARLGRDAGVRLEGMREQALRERLLFHHALCSAGKTLWISWRMQGADGREALPGPFVADLRELFDRGALPFQSPSPEETVPSLAEVTCPRDLANAVIRGDAEPIYAPFQPLLGNVLDGIALERRRHDASPFGEHDGVLADPETVAAVAARYGPAHTFSVSQIEKYIECPFTFFMERVLGVEKTEQPTEELDPLSRGVILHAALQKFHMRHPAESMAELAAGGMEAVCDGLRECLAVAFVEHRWRLGAVPPGLRRVEEARLGRQLGRYAARAAEWQGDAFKPAHFEAAFGRTRGESDRELRSSEPWLFAHEGETAQFSGKIDRIDLDGTNVRLVDYKTGGLPKATDIYRGFCLQLTVYQWAVEGLLLPGRACTEAWYCSLTTSKDQDALGSNAKPQFKARWAARESAARERITEALRGIRRGQFPPTPLNLKNPRCPDAARYQQTRVLRKAPELAGRVQDSGGEDNE